MSAARQPPTAPETAAVTYRLYIHVRRPCRVRAGRLEPAWLPPGWYVYTGSARRGLRARVARHLRRRKRRRWHIDWLLTRAAAEVVHVAFDRAPECRVNRRMGGRVVIPGFGASDCRSGCGSHLRYLGAARPAPVPPPGTRAGGYSAIAAKS